MTRLPAFPVARGMSIKMQTPSVFRALPVRQNLRIALQHHVQPHQALGEEERLIALLGLASDADKPAGELSHGQQQWLEIGMALALRPRLLLLDEPTAGLSPDETFRTGQLIQRLNAEGATVLVVEHDMTFVRQIATSVTVLHLGPSSRAVRSRSHRPSWRRGNLSRGGTRCLRCPDCARSRATPALRGVDFAVAQGEIVALIGRNGVGKSTTMRCLIGLLRASAGTIRYQGRDITYLAADSRARLGIGYIPQGRDVFPRMTVQENLAVGELIGVARGQSRPDPAFRVFPILKERRRQAAGTLSGGEQQQLAIGRALIGGPDLILLDEPSEGTAVDREADLSGAEVDP